MPSYYTLTTGTTAQAQDVNQLINALNGSAGNGVPTSLTAVNDSVNFSLAVKNADPTNSRALQVLRANNNVLIQADASGVIVSPDGGATTGQVLTVNATQTLTNKTLTSPHMTGPVVDSGGLQVTAGNVGIGSAPSATAGLFVSPAGSVTTGIRVTAPTAGAGNYGALISGDVVAGNGIGMGNADTFGYFYLPGGGGAATGVPANSGNGFAIRYNSSTNTIQVYNGAWRSTAALT